VIKPSHILVVSVGLGIITIIRWHVADETRDLCWIIEVGIELFDGSQRVAGAGSANPTSALAGSR